MYLCPQILISVKIIEVVNALEQFAPLPLQADYDNAGMQVGMAEAEISGALLCIDVTERIVDEAVEKGCNLIVSHHPLIFHKLSRITGSDYVQRTVMKAIEHHICILSLHTNVDSVRGGVNYKMAQKLGMNHLDFFGNAQTVHASHAATHQALCGALYRGMQDDVECKADCIQGGEGVIGELVSPICSDDLVLLLKQRFDLSVVMCNEMLKRPIRRIALCGGAGDFLLSDAIKAGADAFVTGEMHYHQYFGHEQEIQICVIGHYESEQYTTEIFRDVLAECCPDLRTYIAQVCTNPILYMV